MNCQIPGKNQNFRGRPIKKNIFLKSQGTWMSCSICTQFIVELCEICQFNFCFHTKQNSNRSIFIINGGYDKNEFKIYKVCRLILYIFKEQKKIILDGLDLDQKKNNLFFENHQLIELIRLDENNKVIVKKNPYIFTIQSNYSEFKYLEQNLNKISQLLDPNVCKEIQELLNIYIRTKEPLIFKDETEISDHSRQNILPEIIKHIEQNENNFKDFINISIIKSLLKKGTQQKKFEKEQWKLQRKIQNVLNDEDSRQVLQKLICTFLKFWDDSVIQGRFMTDL